VSAVVYTRWVTLLRCPCTSGENVWPLLRPSARGISRTDRGAFDALPVQRVRAGRRRLSPAQLAPLDAARRAAPGGRPPLVSPRYREHRAGRTVRPGRRGRVRRVLQERRAGCPARDGDWYYVAAV
jgi:hypothetical protein